MENNLRFTKNVNRSYDDKFAVEGAKIGTALNIRTPPRYLGRTGTAISLEDSVESYTTLTLNTQFGVDISFTSADLALSLDDFSERILRPAVATIANKIDRDGLKLYKEIYNAVGTPGSTPAELRTYLQAGGALDDEAAPMDGLRTLVYNPDAQIEIIDALKGLFQSSEKISDQYNTGRMGTAIGFDWQLDQNVARHTAGAYGAGPFTVKDTVSAAGQATINLAGLTATSGKIAVGDVFTCDAVYQINPQSRESTGKLRKFVVAEGATGTYGTFTATNTTTGVNGYYTADGSGYCTVTVSPAIYISTNKLGTVDAYPTAAAAVTMLATTAQAYPNNLAFHRDAFCLGMADLPLPRGVDMAGRISDKQLGMSIRLVRAYDISTDNFPCRLDVLYGWKTLYPQLACRIAG